VDVATTDESDALTLDEIGERAGATLTRTAVVRTDLHDPEPAAWVAVMDAEHLPDELLTAEQRPIVATRRTGGGGALTLHLRSSPGYCALAPHTLRVGSSGG
jgi:hypothetical protein